MGLLLAFEHLTQDSKSTESIVLQNSPFTLYFIDTPHEAQITAVIDFVMQARQVMFPMLDHRHLPDDLVHFKHHYIDASHGCFLLLKHQGQIIATAAFKNYDHRFSHLPITLDTCVEVVKLFVLPRYRRLGIANLMVNALKRMARQRQIDSLYLHTHPFLAGALPFWQQQGFQFLCQDADPIWHTIHMQLRLSEIIA